MKNAWKLVEAEAYEHARKQALTVKFGKPSRSDYIQWKKALEITAASYDISDSYAWTVNATSNNYGCLALVLDTANKYALRTGITTYVEPTEPPHYNTTIDVNTPTFQRKQLEEENEQKKHDYFTWKGASRGLSHNLRDAMEAQYFSQLKHSIVEYKNVTTFQILDHLDTQWVPMNTKEKKKIKADYYKPWDIASGVALSEFTKRLDEKKEELTTHNIVIDDDDVKEFYMVQMYDSKAFDEADMKEWEKKSEADKDDWTIMKAYFQDKMKLNDAYNTNNNDGNEATLYGSSANITDEQENALADMGDQICEYIQQITQAKENVPPPPSNIKPAVTSNSNNNAADDMNKRMTKLEIMMTNFCNNNNHGGGGNNNNNNNNNRGGGDNNDNKDKRDKKKGKAQYDPNEPYLKYRNMGGYCHSCGFHPVGTEHTSKTCGNQRSNHDENATWTNRGTNGCMNWPTKKVREDQKTHASWAGKSAPTN